MNCRNCGSTLPPGSTACPQCGAPTPSYFTNSETPPNDPTLVASPYNAPQQIPPTDYGPYPQPYDPYSTDAIPPPPPPPPLSLPQRRSSRNRTAIIIAGLLVLILIGAGIYEVISHTTAANPTTKALPTAQATAQNTAVTSTPSNSIADPYPPYTGTLALNDPLSDNSKGYTWDEGSPYSGVTCAFTGGAYQINITQGGIAPCTASNTDFSNFAFQVQMMMVKGAGGGVIFRASGPQYYYFYIHHDGTYGCSLYVNSTSSPKVLMGGSSSAIKTRFQQSNLIGVVANGNSLKLYVNGQLIASVNDSSYSHGSIGLVAEDDSGPAEVIFSKVMVWQL